MATGLFHRHSRDERTADNPMTDSRATTDRVTDDRATDDRATDDRATDDRATDDRGAAGQPAGLGGRVLRRARHPMATAQSVPPGGAVAPPTDRAAAATGTATVPTRPPTGGQTAPTPVAADKDRVVAEPDVEATPASHRWARTSFTATLSLITGVCAVLAALSGRLAPVAIVAGMVGLLLATAGLVAVSRKHVTGHHVALLGLLLSIVGVVFGVLAINKSLPWLNGDADQAGQFRDWLDAQFSWLKNW